MYIIHRFHFVVELDACMTLDELGDRLPRDLLKVFDAVRAIPYLKRRVNVSEVRSFQVCRELQTKQVKVEVLLQLRILTQVALQSVYSSAVVVV